MYNKFLSPTGMGSSNSLLHYMISDSERNYIYVSIELSEQKIKDRIKLLADANNLKYNNNIKFMHVDIGSTINSINKMIKLYPGYDAIAIDKANYLVDHVDDSKTHQEFLTDVDDELYDISKNEEARLDVFAVFQMARDSVSIRNQPEKLIESATLISEMDDRENVEFFSCYRSKEGETHKFSYYNVNSSKEKSYELQS